MNTEELESTLEEYRLNGSLGKPSFTFEAVGDGASVPLWLAYTDDACKLVRYKYDNSISGLNINGPALRDHVNIYFIASDPLNRFTYMRGNCMYTGYKNIILCDLSFMRVFQTLDASGETTRDDLNDIDVEELLIGASPLEISREMARRLASNTILWLIGHEIGHLAHRHAKRHFTFDNEAHDDRIENFDGRFSAEEEQADDFAVEAVTPHMAIHVNWGLNTVFLELWHSLGLNQHPRGPIVLKADSRTHPPLLLRALRLNIKLIEAHNIHSMYYDRFKKTAARIVVEL
jgi:hypothetical protein